MLHSFQLTETECSKQVNVIFWQKNAIKLFILYSTPPFRLAKLSPSLVIPVKWILTFMTTNTDINHINDSTFATTVSSCINNNGRQTMLHIIK